MCGIAGVIRRTPRDGEIEAMLDRLVHRGPDASGCWHTTTPDGWHVALGHRRLSIVDLEGGRQPMANEDGSVQLTFNGEIYNHLALRRDLEAGGHRFATHSDTEAIVHLHEEQAHEGLSNLHGMFAFGLWDNRRQSLTLARDRAGIKTLYWAPLPCGGVAFASELRALQACDGVPRAVSPDGVASLLYRDYVEAPHTIVEGAFKLPPGHWMTWQCGAAAAPRPYWTLASTPPHTGPRDIPALVDELRTLLDEAVHSQLMADVPLGIFLSGGIDSSLVAALAHRHVGDALRTFSIGFEDADYDESHWARLVARQLGARHTERRFSEADLLATADRAMDSLDEPFADPSILPTYLLSEVAAEHVKVALGGDGGDELWAGYPTCKAHRAAALYGRVPRALRRGLVEPLVASLPVRHTYQPIEWKLKRFASRWHDDAHLRHQEWMSGAQSAEVEQAVGRPPRMLGRTPAPPAAGSDLVNEVLALEFGSYLPGSILFKTDRASMAFSLEVRPPLLDEALVAFAFGLPSNLKLRGRTSKWLLKQAARGIIPDAILTRGKKGFGVSMARWIATAFAPRMRAMLAGSPLWEATPLRRDVVTRMFDEHCRLAVDHSKPLWALMILDRWLRRQ